MGALEAPGPLQVELTYREVLAASAEASNRTAPSSTLYLIVMALIFMGAMETGLSLAFMIGQRVAIPWLVVVHQFLSLMLPASIFLVGLWAANSWFTRTAFERNAQIFREQGTPDSTSAVFTITDDGFRLATPRGEWLIKWIAVHRLVRVSGGWVIGEDLGTLFVPSRAFADGEKEAAWLAEIRSRMSAAALANSD